MQKQSEFARNIHDNPVMRLKAADEEARRKSPIGKLKSKHDDERRELNNKIVHESREMHLRHTVERGNAAQLSRPELAMLRKGGKSRSAI
jgi:hypothetical protein